MNAINIRELRKNETDIMEDMMYEAVFQADENNPIPRSVLTYPEVNMYIKDFGKLKNDYCLVADHNGKIVGAVWVRVLSYIIKEYGYSPENAPELVISLFKEYRSRGIGTRLMNEMIAYLKSEKYKQVFLKVEKGNYAVNLYKKLGFTFEGENTEDYFMLLHLQ